MSVETFLNGRVTIFSGDCRDVLRALPDESVHCCVTSPPYFGLRDYDVDGQIGLEPAPQQFVEEMVKVFREVRRVLRDDGTLWLNLGDSYATQGGANTTPHLGTMFADRVRGKQVISKSKRLPRGEGRWGGGNNPAAGEIKAKDLMGVPWAVAFALRADGWYLRQDIIWHKPNPMPESVRDRCTKSHEYLFLLSKSERYFYDGDAIAEPSLEESIARSKRGRSDHHKWVDGGPGNQTIAKGSPSAGRASGNKNHKYTAAYETAGTEEHRTKAGLIKVASTAYPVRNKRSVWTVGSEPFSEAHFASFPPKLIEPCIKAGCPAGGAVLDPFGGAGTTALVAASLSRSATLIELNPKYVKLARARIEAEFMGKEEGARHMIRSLGKVVTTFEPGSLFAGLEVELPATASDIRTPEPTESIDPGQIAIGGPEEECPPKEAGQPGEQDVGETITASARAVSSPALRAPAGPAVEKSGCGQAPDIHSLDPDELKRCRALLAVAAGESISPEAMRDLVGVGFVHVTTSRRVVTEEAMAWLESLGDGGSVRTHAVADAVNGAATSGMGVTAAETATASAFVADYPDIPEFLRRAPATKPLSAQ